MFSSFNPWGRQVRALERNIVSFRALQMMLVIHYGERIRRTMVNSMQFADYWQNLTGKQDGHEGFLVDEKNTFKKSIAYWVDENLISKDEAKDIQRLIKYRNDVAHRTHLLNADLDTRFSDVYCDPDYAPAYVYDYDVVNEMKAWVRRLDDRIGSSGIIAWLDLDMALFDFPAKALGDELSRLQKKINAQIHRRRSDISLINSELEEINRSYTDEWSPRHPYQSHDNGRLTSRGIEICYRLFDEGYSVPAIAIAFRLSISSARRRKAMWEKSGAQRRHKNSLQNMRIRSFGRASDE